MHQNSFGAHQHARKEHAGKGAIVWVSNGKNCKYLALFNTADQEREIPFDLSEILMPGEAYDLLEIWSGQIQTGVKNRIKTEIAPHGAVLYKISSSERL